ncbi:CHASE domain-containing protein [uncultured Roseobacter sp.]|uniref:CHASE domain-containing protein n=1 Tax=uncultured Roseobacter sp. TaxID=114847 RepID=UPI0026160AE1|nr:CHASE domain-containing protein [uncultured Roseobacter sp.]
MRAISFAIGRISTLHIVVVVLSLIMTFSAWQFSKAQSEKRIEQRFNAASEQIVGLIEARLQKYEDALWGGVSTIESHGGDVTLSQWRAFARNLRIDEKYPGINGIGVIHFLTDATMDGYMQARRAERPGYAVFPEHSEPVYMPISFIEPEAANAAAVGLDVAHELNRRTAALASRDTGQAQITGPIVLVQDAASTPGFLFYVPFYRNGPEADATTRQTEFRGLVYAPFVVRNLMDGLLSKDLRQVSVSISDAGQTIYDEHTSAEVLHDPDPMFTETVTMDIYGRTWSLDVRSNLAFRAQNTYAQPTMILIGGLLIEGLIVLLLVLMARANKHAVAYADQVTEDLRLEKQKLMRTNEELEQFAYAASHDLKTPIRGIGGLTEMMKEDLEEYLSSPGANPEVSLSLDLILDRVERMNELTTAIIEFSRTGRPLADSEPLRLGALADALTSDFELQPGQVLLDSAVEVIGVDPVGLRRVLENLVGNAVKYHEKTGDLRVVISCAEDGDNFEFSVSDNGPGIDPKFHTRVFEMFQTLREGDAPESSGIGLAIVKKAVGIHGGEVRLDSACGQGTTFHFPWPKTPGSVTPARSEAAA